MIVLGIDPGAVEETAVVARLPNLRLVSEANLREHWSKRAKRAKQQRTAAFSALLRLSGSDWAWWERGRIRCDGLGYLGKPEGIAVTIVRIAPRKLDSDNLARAAKAIRDGIADWLGIDDGDERIDWRYAQRRGEAGEYAVEIRVEWRTT